MDKGEKKTKYQAKLSGFELECLRYEFTYFKILSRIVLDVTRDAHNSFTVTVLATEDLVKVIEHIRTLKFNKNTWSWGEKFIKID